MSSLPLSTRRRLLWSALAVICALGFLRLSLDWGVYWATSPAHVATRIFGPGAGDAGRPLGISLHVVLRKAYSIVAFAIVGWTAQRALSPSTRPATRMALLVAAFSALIEILQWRAGSGESATSIVVDIACGAVGGYLAIAVDAFVSRRRRATSGT